ncbi:alpha-hydroxy-acid oxidizing protein [Marinomonas spartinae]|nr:alpha-hydroxy-acid oxidizing protein [Marinomonas spartinae]MBJ7553119.1 alpha-hydroxy-acid oxidizing protein [Marinomonas spartinae]
MLTIDYLLYVSNHKDRQLDGALPSFSALPAIIHAMDGEIDIL